MHTAQSYAARYRKSPDAVGSQRAAGRVQPHKERALWNFLTWSFFLAQILAADQYLGGQAKAAVDLGLSTSDSVDAAPPPSDGLALVGNAGSSDTEEIDAGARGVGSTDAGAATAMKSGQVDTAPITLEPLPAQSDAVVQLELSGGSALVANEPAPAGDPLFGMGGDIPVTLLDGISDAVDPLLNTVEDIVAALEDVVGDVTDPLLGMLGDVVGNTLNPLLNTAETIVGALDDTLGAVANPLLDTLGGTVPDVVTATVDGLGDVIDNAVQPLDTALQMPATVLDAVMPIVVSGIQAASGAFGDVVSSAGELAFPVLASIGSDDLYSGGHYTDYNLALQAKLPLSLDAGDATVTTPGPFADIVAALSGGDAGSADDSGDRPHVPHFAIPGVLDELGLRGLGDGIV